MNSRIVQVRMNLINRTRGRWFSCEFIKKDGTLRKMVCRYAVQKGVKPRKGPKLNDPLVSGRAIVWDAANLEFRQIVLAKLISLRCEEINWSAKR